MYCDIRGWNDKKSMVSCDKTNIEGYHIPEKGKNFAKCKIHLFLHTYTTELFPVRKLRPMYIEI